MSDFIWTVIMIVFAVFTVAWLTRGAWMNKKRTYAISKEEMDRLVREEGGIIVDVRTKKQYERGHIPGAVHVLAETAKQDFPKLYPNKERPYILYCDSGMRSPIVKDHLNQIGYTNVHDFKKMKRYEGELERS